MITSKGFLKKYVKIWLMCHNNQAHLLFLLGYFLFYLKYFLCGDLSFLRILFSNVTIFSFASFLHVVEVLCVKKITSNIETLQNSLDKSEEGFYALSASAQILQNWPSFEVERWPKKLLDTNSLNWGQNASTWSRFKPPHPDIHSIYFVCGF